MAQEGVAGHLASRPQKRSCTVAFFGEISVMHGVFSMIHNATPVINVLGKYIYLMQGCGLPNAILIRSVETWEQGWRCLPFWTWRRAEACTLRCNKVTDHCLLAQSAVPKAAPKPAKDSQQSGASYGASASVPAAAPVSAAATAAEAAAILQVCLSCGLTDLAQEPAKFCM